MFLPCTFWLADNYVLQGRKDEACRIFERLMSVASGVGILAEEYDPTSRRLIGNYPKAFSHVALINTAFNLTESARPADWRRRGHSVQSPPK
jgi:GH15 family glucan-1,4-alpha-glucosidase